MSRSRIQYYRPSLEEILDTMGFVDMTTREIADTFGTLAFQSVYNTMCDAKERGWVEVVWRDKYTAAWRRKG